MKSCAELPIAPRLARGATGAGRRVHARSAEPQVLHQPGWLLRCFKATLPSGQSREA